MVYGKYTFILIISVILINISHAQVSQEWVKRINGPINGNDHAHDIAVDNSGNVYTTGWIETASGNPDCHTLKFSPAGDLIWAKTYAGSPNGIDYGYTITVDNNGNAIVGGFGKGSASTWDIFVIKYTPAGDTAWIRRWVSPVANYSSYAYDIAADETGNVYTTGFMSDGVTGGEIVTLKFNSAGVLQWSKTYKGPGISIDYGNCIVIDNSGNVCVAGWSGSENNLHDMTTIKYSPAGDELWVRRYNGTSDDNDYAYWLDTDASGNVYVTGQSVETGSDNDITTIKYSPAGVMLWKRHYNGPANGYDAGWAIKLDKEGNACVTGNHSTPTGVDCATLKYSPEGDLLWVKSYNGPGNEGDIFFSIDIDDSSNIYVSGFAANNGASDFATVRYSSAGNQDWVMLYDGSGSYDGTYAIKVDNSYNVYVAGYSTGSGTDYDYTIIKYSQPVVPVELISFTGLFTDGMIILNWTTATEVNNRGFEIERKAADENTWYTIGFAAGKGTTTGINNYNFTDRNFLTGTYLFRLKQIDFNGNFEYSEEIEVSALLTPSAYQLNQNFPNPFNPSTTVTFGLPYDSHIKAAVYSLNGELMEVLANERMSAGFHNLIWSGRNAVSGVYILRFEAQALNNNSIFKASKKMTLIK